NSLSSRIFCAAGRSTSSRQRPREDPMRLSRRRSERREDIDISPLIDMVFILLIFFMVTTTFVKDMKVDLERPGAASAQSASTKALRIHIDSGANIYIDG